MPCAPVVMPDGLVRNYGYGYPRWFGNGYRAPWTLMPNPSTFVPLPRWYNLEMLLAGSVARIQFREDGTCFRLLG